ncbi:uncharacterized protein B0I36DRAFT_379513 [Microdochium trichocladiopsis]|uniref:Uncharacterized protein n=1 Tax=Microdochium trichocladiopsis TaxID=1682393 RepID=A0A9P9BW94_9PEZI|nr:uncharacterized protein B0I36DRAFT_379513 [Microdochium trichocladiopsis]KAH7040572.1 hypothetical protein B0I36DRAFT_379513 [Microdochium trichocladiopsis]
MMYPSGTMHLIHISFPGSVLGLANPLIAARLVAVWSTVIDQTLGSDTQAVNKGLTSALLRNNMLRYKNTTVDDAYRFSYVF